jgi:hypothetical protein
VICLGHARPPGYGPVPECEPQPRVRQPRGLRARGTAQPALRNCPPLDLEV